MKSLLRGFPKSRIDLCHLDVRAHVFEVIYVKAQYLQRLRYIGIREQKIPRLRFNGFAKAPILILDLGEHIQVLGEKLLLFGTDAITVQ